MKPKSIYQNVEMIKKLNGISELGKFSSQKKRGKKNTSENRIEIFLLFFRLAEEAAQACFEQRDLQSLYTLHMNATKNNDRILVAKVESFIVKLSEKR